MAEDLYFQAIGYINTRVRLETITNDKKITHNFFWDVGSGNSAKSYQLKIKMGPWYLRLKKALVDALMQNPEQELWLRCYPQYSTVTNRVYFYIVNFASQKPLDANHSMFLLKGIWQYSPQMKRPVMSIYRNKLRYPAEKIKNLHIPVQWHGEKAYRFFKGSTDKPTFYQIGVRFDPLSERFIHAVTLLRSEQIPRYLKVPNEGNVKKESKNTAPKSTHKQTQPKAAPAKLTVKPVVNPKKTIAYYHGA